MGLLARRLTEERSVATWLADDDDDGPRTPSGVRVNMRSALGLTTVWRCVDLLSSTISQAPKDVIVKIGGQSFPEYRNRPDWLSLPNPTDPSQTINDHMSQVALSLLIDGNFFTEAIPNIFLPEALIVHDPTRVDVRSGPLYDIKDANGRVVRTLNPAQMLHGAWIKTAGMLRGIAPLEALRRSIGNSIAAEEHAGRFFGQGASLAFGVEVPGQLTPEQKTNLADQLKTKYAGLKNSHAIGVLTAGAKFVPGLAPTPEQAQMLQTRKFSVEEIARPYGIPPGMVGSQEPGASSYASAEVYHQEFRDYAVLPLARRIEVQYERLLEVPPNVSAGASVQFRFNLDHIARTNLLARYQAHGEGVQKGFLTPNEARGLEDLGPLAGGDNLYMQQQMVPITRLPTEVPA